MPSAASLKPSANTVALSALPSPSRVLDQADAVVLDLVARKSLPQMLPVHGDAVGDGAAGEVVVEPVHVAAVVGDARVQPERLGDVASPLLVEAEADGVGQQRLGGPEFDFQRLSS